MLSDSSGVLELGPVLRTRASRRSVKLERVWEDLDTRSCFWLTTDFEADGG